MRVMVAPMKTDHGIYQSLRFLRSKRSRFYSLTEMDQGSSTSIPAIYKVFGRKGIRVFSKDIAEHSQECPIILRTAPWVKVKKFEVHRLSQDVGKLGMGNDRWLAELWYTFFGKTYVLFATHTNAGVQAVNGSGHIIQGTRWEAYKKQMDTIEKYVGKAIMDPSTSGVILQGDLNMMPFSDGRTNFHSPHQMFKRLHMHYRNTRVVYMAQWGMTFNRVHIYPPGANGWLSDHGAIFASLSRNRKAKKPRL